MKDLLFFLFMSFIIFSICTMPIKVAQVSGNSMNTTLENGDILIINTKKTPKINDIVSVRVNNLNSVKLEYDYIVKRIVDITEEGMYLLGDNAAVSYDSRYFGYVPLSNLDGVVVFYF